MKNIFIYFLLFLCSSSLFAQSGLGYLNYRVIKTQNGNGTTWTYNGVTYGGMVDNATEFEGMLDLSNPANTLMSSGEVLSNSSQGLNAGNAPGRPNDYFVVEYTGWFFAELGGQYLFYTYSDDAAQVSIGGNVIGGKYSGPGTSATWITLQANTWYPLQFVYHENAGGSYGYLQVYGPRNGYFIPGGANDVYKVSNQAPVYPHKLQVTYNLKSTLDKTKFNSSVVLTDLGTTSTAKSLSSSGVVNFQEGDGLDETLYSTGNKKATINPGQVEYSYVNPNANWLNGDSRLLIDMRTFGGTSPSSVTNVKIFDAYDGPVTYLSEDAAWAQYRVPSPLTKITDGTSVNNANIRNVNGWNTDYAFTSNPTFEDIIGFTTHKVKLDMDETYFTTTYPDMITIADVAKGFSQLTNQTDSPNGPQGGVFTSDVEFMLGDVNGDNTFDFLDTQMLLQHLFADTSPFSTKTIDNTLLMFDGGYTNSTTSNWSSNKPTTRLFTHTLDENNKEQTKSIDVAFIGDLNFSHSSTLQSVGVSFAKSSPQIMFSKSGTDNVMILDVIKEGDILKVTLDIPQNQNNISGTQFKLNYDEGRLEYVDSEFSTQSISSFTSKRSGYINIGSFSSDGSSTINGGITYTLNFKLKSSLDSTLGLVSLGFSELVNKEGNQVIYIVK